MGVVSSNFYEISVKKKKPMTGRVNVENKPKITDVKATKIVASFAGDAKVPGIIVDFEYLTEYKQDKDVLAEILLKGSILYAVKDEKEAEKLEKHFKENKKLDEDVEIVVLNHILNKGTLLALDLSQKVELPPVINMPRIVRRGK